MLIQDAIFPEFANKPPLVQGDVQASPEAPKQAKKSAVSSKKGVKNDRSRKN